MLTKFAWRSLRRVPSGKVGGTPIVGGLKSVPVRLEGTDFTSARFLSPAIAVTEFFAEPVGHALAVRVVVFPDELVQVLVCKLLQIECIGKLKDRRVTSDRCEQSPGGIVGLVTSRLAVKRYLASWKSWNRGRDLLCRGSRSYHSILGPNVRVISHRLKSFRRVNHNWAEVYKNKNCY
jgi:hypothetical protein